ncbi:MAG: response regulator transcription factor [Chloroflexota bacterium]|nr:MAG: response regulator transcription factor [Chloroflexota bacterium]
MSSYRQKSRVLVVDDNLQSLKMLSFLLQDDGYDVVVASNAETARELLDCPENPIHLAILDVMMPNVDGFDLCSQIRKQGENVPIIFLSARGEPADRAEGLRMGADDYVVKPFDPSELLARIAAVLRRGKSATAAFEAQPSLKLGEVDLDPARLKATVADERRVSLTPTETKLLHCLMRNAGRVLTREMLMSQVWDYDYEGNDNTVDVYIRRLRRKLEPDPEEPRYIQTVRGVGYVFPK